MGTGTRRTRSVEEAAAPASERTSPRARVSALVPPQLRRPDLRGPFLTWLAVGGVVRLLLLPVGITTDTLAVYWRAHVIAFHGEVYREYLVNMGSHAVHAVWLRIVQPLLGPADELWTHPWWWADSFGLGPEHLEAFLARPDALRAITLLKLPYVLAELAAGIVVLWLLWGRRDPRAEVRPDALRRARLTWAFWMLSPAALYATLLFARYEAYPVLAVLLALLLAERDRPWAAAVVLGIGITLRTYPIVLVPVFALVLQPRIVRQLGWAAVALAPFGASMLLNRVVGGGFGELAAVGDYDFGDNWFAVAILPERGPGVYVLAAALLALGLYLLGRAHGWFGSGPVPRTHLWRWVALTHLVVFAFSQFSGHYLMWIVPAIALLLGRGDRPGVVWLHGAQVAGVAVALYALWGGVLATDLLGGVGPTARTLLPVVTPVPGAGGQQVANLAWTAFVIATLALAIPLLVDTLRADGASRRPAPGSHDAAPW